MSDARTPAQIEADIARRRNELAVTLDEIGVRLHPQTIIGDARATVAAKADHVKGRACEAAQRLASGVRAHLLTEDGAPRLERIAAAGLLAVGVVGLLRAGRRHDDA
ncbi:DUF3618 domain-containing protein [Streptomyces gamaensis]|uniref:DUF3618 domain-containing protein n=1 Tax=Streptomyces gamaensis TaxID=1763542 RepID=A0ABW0Z1V1_9ACTN